MTDPAVDPQELRSRLPDGWTVDADGGGAVHGYRDWGEEPDDISDVPASLSVEPRGDTLVNAVWCRPGPTGRHRPWSSKTATPERAVEWLAQKAEHQRDETDP